MLGAGRAKYERRVSRESLAMYTNVEVALRQVYFSEFGGDEKFASAAIAITVHHVGYLVLIVVIKGWHSLKIPARFL